jgi:hypothetical protein
VADVSGAGARRRGLTAAVLAAVCGLATVATAPAQAAPHWLAEGKPLTRPLRVGSLGALGDVAFAFSATGTGTISCLVAAQQMIANPASGGAGTGEVTKFKTRLCEEEPEEGGPLCAQEYHFDPVGLPWRSHLTADPSGVREVFQGVGLEVRCTKAGAKGGKGGSVIGIYRGTLTAKVETNVLDFEAGEGLGGGEGAPLRFTGRNSLKPGRGIKTITAA